MAFNQNKAELQLIRMYEQAQGALYDRMLEMETSGTRASLERRLLRDIDEILENLDGSAQAWARQVIPKAYDQGIERVNNIWLQQGQQPPGITAGFGGVHQESVKVLSANFVDNMQDATQFVGRRIRGHWRQTALEVIAQREATAETLQEAQEHFVRRVAGRGIESFRDVRGRAWNLDAYAKMVVRSTGREVTNVAQMNQVRGMGRDLVQFSAHSDSCERCAPYQGRVFSISGEDERFPELSNVFGDMYPNIHPNCKHSLHAYVEEFDEDPEATRQAANRSLTADPRTQAEKRAYEKAQAKQAAKRATKRQWEEYRAWLPEDAPDSFEVFNRMKTADTANYRELQSKFRAVRQDA